MFVFPKGYSCKYSTYSFQDDATKEILHFELVQVNKHRYLLLLCEIFVQLLSRQ